MKLAGKITTAMIALFLVVGLTVGALAYRAAYGQVDEAAGIELVGCANITTGLVAPEDVEALAAGDTSKLTEIQGKIDWITQHKPIFKEAFILSLDGKILAADSRLSSRGYKAGDSFRFADKDREMAATMTHGTYSDVYTYDGVGLKTGYGPIYSTDGKVIALMAINFDSSIIQERTLSVFELPLLIGALLLAAALLATYFIIRRMIAPVVRLSERTRLLAEGDLSLDALPVRGKDETARLASDFNAMSGSFRGLLSEVRDSSHQVAAASEQLTASAVQTGTTGERIHDVTMHLEQEALRQRGSLAESSELLEKITTFAAQVLIRMEELARQSSESEQHSSAAGSELEQASRQMELTSSAIREMKTAIEDMRTHSREIHQILGVITEISEETHLLALNAAIEAARAGEHGRGFAIVSDSIRKLSDRSGTAVRQIHGIIDSTLGQIEAASGVMNTVSSAADRGMHTFSSASGSFGAIRSAWAVSRSNADAAMEDVKRLSEDAGAIAERIKLSASIADGTHERSRLLADSASEQYASMQELQASSNMLSHLSEDLFTLIDRFKI
ncbi:methyl-accepting chemotaxis protein [Saccharibacillus sp. CPCC 101409]|uniref:methyl-accepting chemotaxis protein n=1 Tax=Saccharibacillus sp. CPCC 101409 TaxID=3058041 RepID=UPI0026725470|nr:methyl-accepting chemotaxis protein [Saccharibacillus sp. CPCC 101409]MDO3408535.1 methyl-accepting chemotaxis protein [Saccharibacillus sp. CPCC 101409]